ncbi:zinc finger protein 808-like [Galleria mellonella]|uniref:Zinc finger protein 808-like n=1 Tax=Galleria mellonella TaxID=7137 RepID=A0ABM3N0V5_GALME|nr:zinc finger protein 808-like [Galleria mellonella]
MEIKKNTIYGQCRCCLAKGNHRGIMQEYYSNGIREVYFDIFMDCFNLFLSTDTTLSTLICSSCVQRLRDANSFRMMVVATERQLLSQLNVGDGKQTVFVNVPVGEHSEHSEVPIKTEQVEDVKEEASDAEFERDTPAEEFAVEDDDSDSEVESKEDEFLAAETALLARFSGSLKPLPTRQDLYTKCPFYVKHLDLFKDVVILPRMIAKRLEEDSRKFKVNSKRSFVTEKMAHITNASAILECSNVIPFRSKSRAGFPCFYCRNVFENLDKLKEHTRSHKKSEIKRILSNYGAECLVVYADISNLSCALCDTSLPNLNELKLHLIRVHNKKIFTDYNDRVIPFKLSQDGLYECQICGFNFETFGSIERHMNVHFRNYVCQDCGTGFVTKYRLKVHSKSMHAGGNFPCDICKKVFTTHQKQKNHVDAVHKMVKRFKCTRCPERFSEYFKRQKHMVEVHGVAPLQYKCNVCDKSFDRRYTLSRHMKRDHLEERDFQCQLCAYRCFTNNELRVHMVKHNGERIFECSVCKKSYARKKTLKEHMRIHNNDRRFACAICGQAFVQKCSLKGHLKTHHHEYSLQ